MRMSNALIPTLRSTPAEAEIISHQLLLKAGFIRRGAAGIYTYMPLAYRVLKKIEGIIRGEMDNAGGQEVLLPIIQPAELWIESGRWQVYGDEMFRVKDRHNRDFCLGPTHEEIITDLVRGEVSSYRQLPLYLYQIQNKYRDERRPRFGLMRGREFIMKDLYSFDLNDENLDKSYKIMYKAYENIFTKCGLNFRPVEADSGAIGGSTTHEFMVLADSGEAEIVYCSSCDYAANTEIAACTPEKPKDSEELKEIQKVETPDQKTINEISDFLQISPSKCIKTLFFTADEEVIAILIRGDRTINEIKVQKIHPCNNLGLASEEEVQSITNSSPGFVGPVGLKNVKIYADLEVEHIINGVCGANEDGYHLINVNLNKDYKVECFADLRLIEEGELCPKCQESLNFARGIEVGQVFKLGTRYSEALNATYLDSNGKKQIIHMGCYGIGVSRTLAATVEQNNDENGIIWPKTIAPYQVIIIPVSVKDEEQVRLAEELYKQLQEKGVEVILDDRNERAGVKFKDADLIGIPVKITIGKKTAENNMIEYKLRTEPEFIEVNYEEVVQKTLAYLND
ncbi:prolyl-tRNA synthetase [Desulfonispora thiosulfatigenes DSM 11270]|uniref:Proline--tRNA ligase n=1 Tax=Desulfonispora thiosulfatigenes DSM 11270 TaxID=656914 RepID=A0A1W1VL85_DESTI|nr:proline--tRNA ligase [Desulfonispora thiosulfatigenes]SMB94043.1 prolyl-tRNA synthetase [Desulfonispora thiosulfatigenes DSM 11270]